MAIVIAVNGLGRIGKLVFYAGLDNLEIESICINDLIPFGLDRRALSFWRF